MLGLLCHMETVLGTPWLPSPLLLIGVFSIGGHSNRSIPVVVDLIASSYVCTCCISSSAHVVAMNELLGLLHALSATSSVEGPSLTTCSSWSSGRSKFRIISGIPSSQNLDLFQHLYCVGCNAWRIFCLHARWLLRTLLGCKKQWEIMYLYRKFVNELLYVLWEEHVLNTPVDHHFCDRQSL